MISELRLANCAAWAGPAMSKFEVVTAMAARLPRVYHASSGALGRRAVPGEEAYFLEAVLVEKRLDALPRGKALLGVLLVVLNYVLLIIPGVQLGFVETTNLFLHLGVIIGLLGVLLGDALS